MAVRAALGAVVGTVRGVGAADDGGAGRDGQVETRSRGDAVDGNLVGVARVSRAAQATPPDTRWTARPSAGEG